MSFRRWLTYKTRVWLQNHLQTQTVNVRGVPIRMMASDMNDLWRASNFSTKEPETLNWIDTFTDGKSLFIDVGAHIGQYSLYAAKKNRCAVIAIEPDPINYAKLTQNIDLNDLRLRDRFSEPGVITPLHAMFSDASPTTEYLDLVGLINCRICGAERSSVELVTQINLNQFSHDPAVCEVSKILFQTGVKLFDEIHIKIDVEDGTASTLRAIRTLLEWKGVRSLMIEMGLDQPLQDGTSIRQYLGGLDFRMVNAMRIPNSKEYNCIFIRS